MDQTTGERRVRTSFNVAEGETRSQVDAIKYATAKLIDECDAFANSEGASAEQKRLAALAMTNYEAAAMWAVKAVTA